MAESATIIRTLLLSDALPRDIVIQEIFAKHLYKEYSPLNSCQKHSILRNHFLFKKILMLYYRSSFYSRVPNSADYFLSAMDNDLFLAINDGRYLLDHKSEYFENHPELFKLSMLSVEDEDLPAYVYDVWCMLTHEKKQEVYHFIMLHRNYY